MGPRQELLPPGPPPSVPHPAGAPDPFSQDEQTGWVRRGAARAARAAAHHPRRDRPGRATAAGLQHRRAHRAQFEAKAQVLVEPDMPHPLEGSLAPQGPGGSYYETQCRILRSRSLARRTLVSLANPEPASAAADGKAADGKPGTSSAG